MTGPGAHPPFARVAIAGLGLIGGSIALRLRQKWPSVTIVGVDTEERLALARARGAIDEVRSGVTDLDDVELIVLATPVPVILDLLAAIGSAGLPALVTDVGSTKRRVLEAAADAGVRRFVGGHPMAGSERGGLDHARADLFLGRPWILVGGRGPSTAVDELEPFVRRLGAVPHRLDAPEHDRVMAYVSHLPQLLAVALMNTAAEGCGVEGLAAAGPAFREMTRLAASPPDLWRGIVATNGDYIAEALHALADRLSAAGTGVVTGGVLDEAFAQAAAWRREVDGAFSSSPTGGPGKAR